MVVRIAFAIFLIPYLASQRGFAAEVMRLSDSTLKEYAPAGKEADAIIGDYVLRNEHSVDACEGHFAPVEMNAVEISMAVTRFSVTLSPLGRDQSPA